MAVLGLPTRQMLTPEFGLTDGVLLLVVVAAAGGSTDGVLLVAAGGSIHGVLLVEVDGSIGGNSGQWINFHVRGRPSSAKHTTVSFG